MFAEAAARAAPASTRPAAAMGEGDGEDATRERTVAAEILEACASGDPFTALSLPKPEFDDAGRPVWDVTEGQISKAFRKRSLAVHPDKNPSAEAKVAFDKLNEWHRALKDPVKRGEALRKHADDAFRERCRLQPELVARMKRDQERRDASDYGAEILRQQRERAERAAAMRDKARLFRKRHREEDEEDLLLFLLLLRRRARPCPGEGGGRRDGEAPEVRRRGIPKRERRSRRSRRAFGGGF